MNTDAIIELAKQAELGELGERGGFIFYQPGTEGLERFAHLVRAAALEEAAGVCDAEFWNATKRGGAAAGIAAGNCAAAIRELKETT